MTTITEYIRAGYEIKAGYASYTGASVGHHIVLQKGESVVIASLPTSGWTGKPKPSDNNRPHFIEVP